MPDNKYQFYDFTEKNYRQLIQVAKKNYTFISYKNYKKVGKSILWRHDIDASVHRSLALAKIEAKEGVNSTYFLYLHSNHYNFYEDEIVSIISDIKDLGHYIGLHFDPVFYGNLSIGQKNLNKMINHEKAIIKNLFGAVTAISIHQPDTTKMLDLKPDKIEGLVNAYSEFIMKNYSYCSDSNGYWRYKRLCDVLVSSNEENIQVLTHPEWWTPDVMSPRERISRCINGRANKQHMKYDTILKELGRENVK